MTSEWYLSWFGKDYLDLYRHRDNTEASQQVEFIIQTSSIIPNPSIPYDVLDIACSRGRHTIEFAKAGYQVVGIDRSREALELAIEALENFDLPATLIEADMREIPFDDQSFGLAISMFTSFGYFQSDQEHQDLLKEWRRCLSHPGCLVIDYLNKPQVIKTLVPQTEEEKDRKIILQERSISPDQSRVNKKITLKNTATGETKEFQESVRMYSPDEMLKMLTAANFSKIKFFGDFTGEAFTSTSPRLVIFAETK